MAMEFLQGHWDSYMQNTNNYFLYKSPEQNRFIYISWDFDFTMGNGPVNMKEIAVGDYKSYNGIQIRPLTVALLNVPSYRALFEKNLQSIVDTLYSTTKSFAVIDSVVNFIQDDVAWDKTLPHVREGLEALSLSSLTDIIAGGSNGNAGRPISFNLLTATDYLIRINSDISFTKAINGKTGHSSVFGVKEWIQLKLNNYKIKSTYKSILSSLPIIKDLL